MKLLAAIRCFLVSASVIGRGQPQQTMEQGKLSLELVRLHGEPKYTFKTRTREFNQPTRHASPEKLFADLLKRLARRAMADVTECPPDTLPVNLARLEMLQEIFGHVLRHDFKDTPEARPSGRQLLLASTLHDFAACLRITREQHRAPAFINSRDGQLAEINHKIDLLAGLLANYGEVPEAFKKPLEEI